MERGDENMKEDLSTPDSFREVANRYSLNAQDINMFTRWEFWLIIGILTVFGIVVWLWLRNWEKKRKN